MLTCVLQVRCWSRHMLLCAPDTVYLALSWIHAIRCSPGDAHLLATLSVVFSDGGCHAVHLLCAELRERPEAVLTAVPALAAGRPVNVFYLQGPSSAQDGGSTADYLRRLSLATGGRCHALPVGLNGELKEVCVSYTHTAGRKALIDTHFCACVCSGDPTECCREPRIIDVLQFLLDRTRDAFSAAQVVFLFLLHNCVM